jgi:sugar lactone lactonase YvrE
MKGARALLALSGLALAVSSAGAQTIETIAGGGPGNGSPALAINLRTPQDVVRDATGSTYFAVSDDRRVYRILSDGSVQLVAGSGGSGSSGDGGLAVKAELTSPRGLAFDTDGSLLVADQGGRRVRRVDLAAGTISTLIGGGSFTGEGIPALQIALDAPRDVVVAADGDVFVADGHRVRRLVRASGLVSTVAGTGVAGFSDGSPASTRRLNEPRGLAFDPAGRLLIADGGNGRIRSLDLPTDTLSTLVSGVCSPGGVAADAAGAVYLSSNAGGCGSNAQKILKWTSGSLSTVAATGSSFVAQISALPDGTLLVADRDGFRLKSITAAGVSTVIAGNGTIGYYGDGVPGLSASMLSPTQVRADALGNILVYDNTSRIRRITPAGMDVTVASAANCGSDPKAFLCSVEGLAILPGGALAVSESKDDRIHIVDPDTGAEIAVTVASLGRPRGIAASASGFVFVADRGAGNNNGAIRKVDASTGSVTVVASGLARPQYVAVDGAETVYFTTLNGSSIQRIPAGGAPATYVTFTSAVTGVDADAAGNVYASDSNNQVWRIAAGTGVKTLYAGSGVAGLGDGGPSVAASLSAPGGLSVVGSDLYVADALNYRIRLVRSNVAPSADAGPDQVVEATSPGGATVTLDGAGSSDPDGNPLTYAWTGPFGTASGSTTSVDLPLGTHTITLSVSDGQASASDTLLVTVQDTLGPVITYERSPLPNSSGWNNGPVTITVTCVDSGSGLRAPAPAPEIVASEGAGQERTFHCEDASGNTASLTVSDINIDTTAPEVTGARTPLANANGWNNTDVTVSVSATDALSGVAECEQDVVLSVEGASQSATMSCTDLAGNSASASVGGINIDKTAPEVTGSRSPLANTHGWNNTDVTVGVSATDSLSGVAECEPDVVLSLEGAGQSVTRQCTDLAGNSASVTVASVSIDKTAPEVAGELARPADKNGWYNHAVSISWSGTDALSGVLSCSSDATYAGADALAASVSGQCSDRAGNEGTSSLTLNYDATAPTVSIVTPPSGAIYTLNQNVAAQYTCADNLSGVDTCAGPVESGAAISTSPVGAKSFVVNVTDAAGNSGSVTRDYAVQFRFVGFLQPVDNLPVVNLANAGKTVPIKWQLKDAAGALLPELASVVSLLSAPLACDAAPSDIIEEEAPVTGGTLLRYDAIAGQFVFNWSTQKSWAGTCAQIQLTLSDGTKQFAKFKFR